MPVKKKKKPVRKNIIRRIKRAYKKICAKINSLEGRVMFRPEGIRASLTEMLALKQKSSSDAYNLFESIQESTRELENAVAISNDSLKELRSFAPGVGTIALTLAEIAGKKADAKKALKKNDALYVKALNFLLADLKTVRAIEKDHF